MLGPVVAAQLTLVVVGLFAELVALGLAVWEVHLRRVYVQEHRERPRSVAGSGTAMWSVRAKGVGARAWREPPTIEQRLDALEAGLTAVHDDAQHAERGAVEKAKAHVADVSLDVQARAERDMREVRDLLLSVTAPTWQVWTSLGLLVLGVVLQAIASGLGAVSR